MSDFKWGDESESKAEVDTEAKDSFVESIGQALERDMSLDDRLKAEELYDMMVTAGKAMSEIETEPEQLCKFCGCPVDDGLEHEWRKSFPRGKDGELFPPKELLSRMSYGFQRDKDGQWMHMNAWQCILSWQWHNVLLPIPGDLDN